MLVAFFRQGDGALLLVEFVVFRHQIRNERIQCYIKVRLVIAGAGNDEWCAGFIDENRVNFVDDAEVVATLHHLFEMIFHIVA